MAELIDQWDGLLAITALKPSRTNPRGLLTDEGLSELAESIRQFGVLTRLLVRPLGKSPRIVGNHWEGIRGWEIVLGERRWRAAKLAGLDAVPVTIRLLTAEQARQVQILDRTLTLGYSLTQPRRRSRRILGLTA